MSTLVDAADGAEPPFADVLFEAGSISVRVARDLQSEDWISDLLMHVVVSADDEDELSRGLITLADRFNLDVRSRTKRNLVVLVVSRSP